MPLRSVARVLTAIWQALRSIQQGIDMMSAKYAALTAAFAVLSGSVTSAVAEILSLQQQHQTDLATLASRADANDDAELASLVLGMTARAQSITDAIGALHQNVTQTATDTKASIAADTGSDSVSGTSGSDTVAAAAETESVTGADSVAGAPTADSVAGAAS